MTVLAVGTSATTTTRYSLRIATSPEDFAAVARMTTWNWMGLSWMGFEPRQQNLGEPADGHDHLIVVDESDGAVVGWYPMVRPRALETQALETGGSDAERSFELGNLAQLRPDMVEAGRISVRPDHLDTGVVDLMWVGLAHYLHLTGHRWLGGCVQIPASDGFASAEDIWMQVSSTSLAPPRFRVRPRQPLNPSMVGLPDRLPARLATQLPTLLQGYLRLGAWVCGPPSINRDLPVADLFVLLSLDRIDPRYLRSFATGPGRRTAPGSSWKLATGNR